MTGGIANTAYDYGTATVELTSSSGVRIDISKLLAEINIHESLTKPYITGTIVVIDSANVFNKLNLLGQEVIDIKQITNIHNDPIIEGRRFAITGIKRQTKIQDSASVFVISFTSAYMYINKKFRFSKKYDGKPENIISDISNETLNVPVSIASSEQSEMRVIIPFTMSPLESMVWLKNRCTTSNGIPFFLHANSIYDKQDGLNLVSFKELLDQPEFNSGDNNEFKYSSVTATETAKAYTTEKFNSLKYKIASFDVVDNEKTLSLMENAGYGAQYLWVDTIEDKAFEKRYRVTEELSKLPSPNSGQYDYDPNLPDGLGKPLHEGVSAYVSQITTTKLFEDKLSYNEEDTSEKHQNKARSNGLKAFSVKETITIQCPGFAFMEHKKGLIGNNQINLYIPRDQPAELETNPDEIKDIKRSGKYIIVHQRHMFKNKQYNVILTCIKIDNASGLGSGMAASANARPDVTIPGNSGSQSGGGGGTNPSSGENEKTQPSTTTTENINVEQSTVDSIQNSANNALGAAHEQNGLNSAPPADLLNNNRDAAEYIAYVTDGYDVTSVVSGYRNVSYNTAVGGKTNSMHLQNRAIDFKTNAPVNVVQARVSELQSQGAPLGYSYYAGSGFWHFDNGGVRTW
jgi:hypothetical protein